MRKYHIILIFIFLMKVSAFTQEIVGVFICPGGGARFPVGQLSKEHSIGYGFGTTIEYASSGLPLVIKADLRFGYFPQKEIIDNYYSQSYNYSAALGVNYFFSPIFSRSFIALSFCGADVRINFKENKRTTFNTVLDNSVISTSDPGLGGTIGFSVFLVDFTMNYYWFNRYSFISLETNIRLPVFISY